MIGCMVKILKNCKVPIADKGQRSSFVIDREVFLLGPPQCMGDEEGGAGKLLNRAPRLRR